MATGGMGDGVQRADRRSHGQGIAPFDAARAGVSARAGWGQYGLAPSQAGMIAGDVIEELPHVFGRLRCDSTALTNGRLWRYCTRPFGRTNRKSALKFREAPET